MGRTMRALRAHGRLVAAIVVSAAYLAALVAWTSGPKLPYVPPAATRVNERPATGVPSGVPASGASTAAPGDARSTVPSSIVPNLPTSATLNGAGAPARSVIITVTSDAPILRLGYIVANVPATKHYAEQVASPVRLELVAHSYGLVAAVAAQAAPTATYVTCTISVDGDVRVTRTLKGPWRVDVCTG